MIAERTKIKREMTETPPEPEPAEPEPAEPEETEPPTPPPEPLAELPAEDSAPEPEPPAEIAAQVSLTREEIQTLIHSTLDQRRPPERRYTLVDGMYVKIK